MKFKKIIFLSAAGAVFAGAFLFAGPVYAASIVSPDYSAGLDSSGSWYVSSTLLNAGAFRSITFAGARFDLDGTRWHVGLYTGCADASDTAKCARGYALAPATSTQLACLEHTQGTCVGLWAETWVPAEPGATIPLDGGAIFTFSNVANWGLYGTSTNLFSPQAVFTGGHGSIQGGTPYVDLEYDGALEVRPVFLSALDQYREDGTTVIVHGGATNEDAATFRGMVRSSSTNPLRLEIDLAPFGTPFSGIPTAISGPVLPGGNASIVVHGMADGHYAWRARAFDVRAGIASEWQEFGASGEVDLVVEKNVGRISHLVNEDYSMAVDGGGAGPGAGAATWYLPAAMVKNAPFISATFADERFVHDGTRWSVMFHTGCIDAAAAHCLHHYPLALASSTQIAPSARAMAGYGVYAETYVYSPMVPLMGNVIFEWWNPYAFNFYGTSTQVFPGTLFTNLSGSGSGRTPYIDLEIGSQQSPGTPSRAPVVIVPGVMGSYLDRASDGTEAWPNIANMLLSGSDSYLDDIAFSSSGRELAGKEMNAPDIIRTAGIVPVFKPLIDSFKDAGYVEGKDLFVAPYDWRMGIASSSASVGAVIRNAIAHSETGGINIIAHSMGGLVVKDYLTRATSTQFLDKLILLGVPQLGAPKTFITLNYGDDLGLRWFGLGLNKNKIKEISQNMPGIYELLPGRRYVDVAGGYVQDWRGGGSSVLGYDGTAAFMTGDPANSRNPRLLNEADAVHGALDGAAFNAQNVYNVVGCHVPTIVGFNVYDGGVLDVVRAEGDGTVPEVSAMNLANGFHNYFVLGSETGIDHTGLIKSGQSLALVRAIIGGQVSSTSSLPQGISTSLADCVAGRSAASGVETTIEVSSHSPAALNAYDTAGRHTGPNASGDIDVQIPGSSYEAMQGNSFILLPASDTYRIVANGLAAGMLTLKRKGYGADAKLLRTAAYLQIPLASASTKATLIVGSSTPASDVALDLDGDGMTDRTIHPTALLTASSSADIAPPALTVSPIPASVTAGATTTIVFSFTDADSGVATSSAVMNGRQFISGKTVKFETPGTTTIRFFAEDRAGNPLAREYSVNVAPREAHSCGRSHRREDRPGHGKKRKPPENRERRECERPFKGAPVSGDDIDDIMERQ